MIGVRICVLSIILLLAIDLYLALTKADNLEQNYKSDRFLSLQIHQGSRFLPLDSPEVKYIEAQGRIVWRKIFFFTFAKGLLAIGIYSIFIVFYFLNRKRKT